MKNFFISFILTATLFATVILFNYGIVFISGEMLSYDEVIDWQNANKTTIYGCLFNNDYRSYKTTLYSKLKPSIVVAGSSRTLHYSSTFFSKNMANCGLIIKDIHSLKIFANHMRETGLPDLMILGIDHWWLNETIDARPSTLTVSNGDEITFDKLFLPVKLTFAGKIDLTETIRKGILTTPPTEQIGIRAVIQDGGFRYDGSTRENKDVIPGSDALNDFKTAGYSLINSQSRPYRYGTDLHHKTIHTFFSEIEALREEGVKIIMYTPPLAPEYYDQVMRNPKYAYIKKLIDLMQDQYGVYNLLNPATLELKKYDFFDLIHTRPGATAKIVYELAKTEPEIKAIIRMDVLDKVIQEDPKR